MKILIVDDSAFVRQCIQRYIQSSEIAAELETACSGEEGLKIYKEKKPDVIITDLLMPGMGGEAFIQKVRGTDQDTRIIVITADVQKAVRESIESLRVSAFLSKPVTRESIASTLTTIIQGC